MNDIEETKTDATHSDCRSVEFPREASAERNKPTPEPASTLKELRSQYARLAMVYRRESDLPAFIWEWASEALDYRLIGQTITAPPLNLDYHSMSEEKRGYWFSKPGTSRDTQLRRLGRAAFKHECRNVVLWSPALTDEDRHTADEMTDFRYTTVRELFANYEDQTGKLNHPSACYVPIHRTDDIDIKGRAERIEARGDLLTEQMPYFLIERDTSEHAEATYRFTLAGFGRNWHLDKACRANRDLKRSSKKWHKALQATFDGIGIDRKEVKRREITPDDEAIALFVWLSKRPTPGTHYILREYRDAVISGPLGEQLHIIDRTREEYREECNQTRTAFRCLSDSDFAAPFRPYEPGPLSDDEAMDLAVGAGLIPNSVSWDYGPDDGGIVTGRSWHVEGAAFNKCHEDTKQPRREAAEAIEAQFYYELGRTPSNATAAEVSPILRPQDTQAREETTYIAKVNAGDVQAAADAYLTSARANHQATRGNVENYRNQLMQERAY
ncbi:MAG: hypothetical protein QUV02_02325 [Maricaulis sp.]|uniref:hypothetical protein n=1 Tax=Maricaulis sp. TaxID=1486257 RepID=UPI0026059871|nr:hypothetical protein [Maricaulis sp.]MDM7983258.1 hypothetical protein [Maricaulis sp.]